VAWHLCCQRFRWIYYLTFQCCRQNKTCRSAILLQQITIDSFMLTKTPGMIIDNDATRAFDRVICRLALIALQSLNFASSFTRMLGTTWRQHGVNANVILKWEMVVGVGVSKRYYQSTAHKQTFGLVPSSTAASDIWCIIHDILMHMFATYFIAIIFVSVSSSVLHNHVGEGLIDKTGLVTSAQSSIESTPSGIRSLSPDEAALFTRMQNILQFFLELLQVAGGDLNIS
jgi:hypothetical protein